MNQIGRYEILGELGRGAMGAVYKARDPQIGRTVAIKVILTANLSPADLQHYKERFKREAQTAGQMSHPGIITIHDISEDEQGQPFLVMEFVEGQTLEKMLLPAGQVEDSTDPDTGLKLPTARPRLLIDRSLDLGVQLADALNYAHERGVIHRDIKPSNIIITSDGRAKIADFGIAKVAGTSMTQTGMMMGTPAFMSPEQASAAPLDSRTDIFSLGAVLYWMFTGEKPFPGDSMTAIILKVVTSQPLPATYLNPALPKDVDTVLGRCLAKVPDDRYPNGRELAEDLRAIKEKRPIKATAPPPVEITAMQPSPIRTVAKGLPVEQREVQQEAALAGGPTVHAVTPTAPGVVKPASADQDVTAESPRRDAAIASAKAVAAVAGTAAAAAPAREPAPPSPPLVPEAVPLPAPKAKSSAMMPIMLGAGALILVAAGYFAFAPKSSVPPDAGPVAVGGTAPSPAPVTQPSGSPGSRGNETSPATSPASNAGQVAPAAGTAADAAAASSGSPAGTGASRNVAGGGLGAPASSKAPRPATGKLAPIIPKSQPKAQLDLLCKHNFKMASITILAGGKVIHQGTMTDKQKNYTATMELPAGENVIQVRVQSDEAKYDEQKETGGTFQADMARKLTVDFGFGSGGGFAKRKLSLKLGESTPIASAPTKK